MDTASSHWYTRNEQRDLITRPLSPDDIPQTYERHIVISDYHHRNYVYRDYTDQHTEVRKQHDERALAVVEKFMQGWQPTHVHYAGDWVDFQSMSKFCEGAPSEEEAEESFHAVRCIIRRHRMMFPKAEMDYELGNHEVRWERYLRKVAAAIGGLRGLSYERMLDSKSLNLAIYPYNYRVPIIPGLLDVVHGDKVRPKSGATAHAMLDKGVSGVSGHTHRLGMVYRTTRAGTTVWAENGCLCSLTPDYLADPDWQQGFSIIYVDRGEGRFQIENIPILHGRGGDYRIYYAGALYEA